MIVRIVKMTFRKREVNNFIQVFENSKDKIRAFPGVQHLELLQESEDKNIFFTYSIWESAVDLENYRCSTLFKETWAKTKPLFEKPAEAWSTHQLHLLT